MANENRQEFELINGADDWSAKNNKKIDMQCLEHC